MAQKVSLSPTAQNYYLEVLSAQWDAIASAASEYSPSTASFLSRLSLVALLGYFGFLLLVLLTHGNIPEVIKKGNLKNRNITPSFVFFTCSIALGLSWAVLSPLEHFFPSSPLAAPVFGAMGAFRLPTVNWEALAFFALVVSIIHGASWVLYSQLPATEVQGYVLTWPEGSIAVYRLPGLRSLVAGAGAWLLGVRVGLIPPTLLWDGAWEVAGASCIVGLAVSAAFFIRGSRLGDWHGLTTWTYRLDYRSRCPTKDMRTLVDKNPLPKADKSEAKEFKERGPMEHFYCGLSEFNPVTAGLDWKMWLYSTGALMLQLNIFSALAANAAAHGGQPTNACCAIGACLTFFVLEYMWNEEPHLYTYDIIRERIGFKLLWGCLCWYPCFYCVTLATAVGAAGDTSATTTAACVGLFFAGWTLTRGSNMQKFYCKTSQGTPSGKPLPHFLGLFSMQTVAGSQGRILCGGFWGLARHINYFGEILQAFALALLAVLAGGSWAAMFYPLYYVAIFVPRQVDDDAVCCEKYGSKVWAEYTRLVPHRIVPGVY